MGWLFNRIRRADVQLMDSVMTAETKRREQDALVQVEKSKLELRKIELEFANLEAVHEQKRKDRAEAEDLRQKRKQWAATTRQNMKQKAQNSNQPGRPAGTTSGCPACNNPSDPSLSADVILWHHNGHPGAADGR